MQYLNYGKYKELGGTADVAAYTRYEISSRRMVDYYTHQRIIDDVLCTSVESLPYSESLEALMFELIELSQKGDMSKNEITSVSNNGISTSYQTVSAEVLKTEQKRLILYYLKGFKSTKKVELLWVGV